MRWLINTGRVTGKGLSIKVYLFQNVKRGNNTTW